MWAIQSAARTLFFFFFLIFPSHSVHLIPNSPPTHRVLPSTHRLPPPARLRSPPPLRRRAPSSSTGGPPVGAACGAWPPPPAACGARPTPPAAAARGPAPCARGAAPSSSGQSGVGGFFIYSKISLLSAEVDTRQLFAECPTQNTRQKSLCRHLFAMCRLPCVAHDKSFAVSSKLAESP